MSKSKPSRRNKWDDYEEDYSSDYKSNKEKRREKRMKNLIRSKNVDRILDMDDDEPDYNWVSSPSELRNR
jgi:hypothetical protein